MAAQPSFCYQCDTRNPEGAQFCVICGAKLEHATPQTTAQQAAYTPQYIDPAAIQPQARPVQPTYAPQPAQPPYAPNYAASAYAAPAFAAPGAPVIQQHFHINQAMPPMMPPAMPHMMMQQQQPAAWWIRALWFLFVGLWIGGVWMTVAWVAMLTIVGLPLGLWMINKMPEVMTLRPTQQKLMMLQMQGMQIQVQKAEQPFMLRALYFVFVGWWASLLWIGIAWAMAATMIGLPLSFIMFERTAAVATLAD
jgi:uncharacterized membrane protein YccF (DUF307 family)